MLRVYQCSQLQLFTNHDARPKTIKENFLFYEPYLENPSAINVFEMIKFFFPKHLFHEKNNLGTVSIGGTASELESRIATFSMNLGSIESFSQPDSERAKSCCYRGAQVVVRDRKKRTKF